MQKIKLFSLLFFAIFLSGCFSDTATYEGISYPQATDSQFTFQGETVPDDCRVFAHLMMNSKGPATGKDISTAMHTEAESKGANLVLIGMTREMPDEQFEENRFDYYGPEYDYSFQRTWLGWKFGFDEWDEAGSISDLGSNSWGNGAAKFDNSLLIQAVFLHCDKK